MNTTRQCAMRMTATSVELEHHDLVVGKLRYAHLQPRAPPLVRHRALARREPHCLDPLLSLETKSYPDVVYGHEIAPRMAPARIHVLADRHVDEMHQAPP